MTLTLKTVTWLEPLVSLKQPRVKQQFPSPAAQHWNCIDYCIVSLNKCFPPSWREGADRPGGQATANGHLKSLAVRPRPWSMGISRLWEPDHGQWPSHVSGNQAMVSGHLTSLGTRPWSMAISRLWESGHGHGHLTSLAVSRPLCIESSCGVDSGHEWPQWSADCVMRVVVH